MLVAAKLISFIEDYANLAKVQSFEIRIKNNCKFRATTFVYLS
jgi:hypothetical protein